MNVREYILEDFDASPEPVGGDRWRERQGRINKWQRYTSNAVVDVAYYLEEKGVEYKFGKLYDTEYCGKRIKMELKIPSNKLYTEVVRPGIFNLGKRWNFRVSFRSHRKYREANITHVATLIWYAAKTDAEVLR